MNRLFLASLLLVFMIIAPSPAFAYLDPGTGSYVLQILLAALVGTVYAVKTYWGKIRSVITRILHKKEESKAK
jgi:hypothetical protein